MIHNFGEKNLKMKGKIISFALISSLVILFLPVADNQIIAIHSSKDFKVRLTNLTSNEPIIITNDDNFTDYSLSGDGSILTPYRIESLNITSITDETAIKIYHTTKHFIIKNCYLRTLKYGIDLFNVSVGTAQIVDNTIEGIQTALGAAIYIKSTNSSYIANNTILYPEYTGVYTVYLWSAHHTIFFNNTALDVTNYSKLFFVGGFESDSLILVDNKGTNLDRGFDLYKCPNAIIANNTLKIVFGAYTLQMDSCPDSIFDNNYLETEGGTTINIYSSPSNITNNIMFNVGIRIWESDPTMYRAYKIENNKINNKDIGFFVDTLDLVIDQGSFGQIILYNCNNTKIENIEFNIPILHIQAVACNFINITNNVFDCEIYYTYGDGAIYLRLCQNASVSFNYYYLCGEALYLVSSHNCSFNHNIVYDTGGDGVHLYSSNSSEIYYNLFQYAGSGVQIDWYSYHNVIHHNTFIYSPGRDDSSLNIWYDTTTMEGNYWSVYDGIGPYEIPGSAGAEDPFPLSTPPVPIIVEFGCNLKTALLFLLIPIIVVVPYLRKRKR